MRWRVVEVFPVTGRGLVLVLDGPLPAGAAPRIRLGDRAWPASKEWLLRREPVPHEEEALLLRGAMPGDAAVGDEVEVEVS
ncbi:MAG: hypothetical protein ABIO70_21145 [Pseudomonadota bacterium]